MIFLNGILLQSRYTIQYYLCVCERTACKQGINKYYTLINILPSRGFRNCIKITMKKNEKV